MRRNNKLSDWEVIAAAAVLAALLAIVCIALYEMYFGVASDRSFVEAASETLRRLLFSRRQ